jgi:hypothetical protein
MPGRLINKFVAVIYRVDTAATAAVVGGGFDPEFGEAVPLVDGTLLGASSLREMAPLRIECQIDRKDWGGGELSRSGGDEKMDIILTLSYRDLEVAGLIDANGAPTLYPGDRIDSIERLDGTLQEKFPNPPGMYVTDLGRAGHGLSAFRTPRFNLLDLFCSRRKQASTGGI